MELAIEQSNPDMVIHLGDCIEDARELQERYPHIPMEMVPGNCDCSMEEAERVITVSGHYILICHGHTRRVKSQIYALECAALEKGVDIALFGHTHQVFNDWHNGIRIYNPGSIGSPGLHIPPSYGIITIDKKDVQIETFYLE